ncbi:MAG: hypothetical protein WDN69_09570 [Aliidongia sp.]
MQELQEVQPLFDVVVVKEANRSLPICVHTPILRSMACTGIVDAHPARRGEPGFQHLLGLGDEGFDLAGQDPHNLALGDSIRPDPRSKATIRSTVDWPW